VPRYPGGLIRKTPVTPTGPLQNGAASGVWSLADAAYWTKQGLWPTAGNFLAIEDVFSTWLYTGNGSTQTITNGINLSGSGGMVWTKNRVDAQWHCLADTARGSTVNIFANSTEPNQTQTTGITSFNSNGYSIGSWAGINNSSQAQVSWTFREAPNFFDVVTYTGNGAVRTIAHNLGVAPGCIIIKDTGATGNWWVYHRSTGNASRLFLNTTDASGGNGSYLNSTNPTATNFTLGANTSVNNNGSTYVAYLYAHDTASTGLIQCGSFTTDGSGLASVTLGYEPQWILVKRANAIGNWILLDTMRGLNYSSNARLFADLADAESAASGSFVPTATGFNASSFASSSFVYIAIRRGPMKTPTLGTSVFAPLSVTSSTTGSVRSFGFSADTIIGGVTNSNTPASNWFWIDRLRGFTASTDDATGNAQQNKLLSSSTAAETANTSPTNPYLYNIWNSSALQGTGEGYIGNGGNLVYHAFRRAPGFFDEVCFTGTGAVRTVNHNLGVVPELIIVKSRSVGTYGWVTFNSLTPSTYSYMRLNNTSANFGPNSYASSVMPNAPTATTFSLGTQLETNESGATFVAYLFASCPGVSKVGSYTGNGSSQTINCAFTTGARYVLIKRTDSTGSWLVWDSARGIVAGNDPYLALNLSSAQVTTDDSVDTDNTGFIVNQVAASNVNVNAATYIFLAIA
jgi:hypothetical protein